jgi:hypothetical protein
VNRVNGKKAHLKDEHDNARTTTIQSGRKKKNKNKFDGKKGKKNLKKIPSRIG